MEWELTAPTPNAQALIDGPDGTLLANSRVHTGPGGAIITEPLNVPPPPGLLSRIASFVYDHLSGSVTGAEDESGMIGSGAGEDPDAAGWANDARDGLR